MYFFRSVIKSLDDWEQLYRNDEAFVPLVRQILALHRLPSSEIRSTGSGSHAVFRSGEYIVKIYAPDETGWICESDFHTEVSAMVRANQCGISAPELVAYGRFRDRYPFRYLIQKFVHGTVISKATLSEKQKYDVGRQLRTICRRFNTPCEPFNSYRFPEDALTCEEWDAFPRSFRQAREAYIRAYRHGTPVCVHGDIHQNNVILGEDGRICLIDFADSVIAPVEYEYASLIPGMFLMEKSYLDGFFGAWDVETLTEQLTYGICIHRFGGACCGDDIFEEMDLRDVKSLRNEIYRLLYTAKFNRLP